MTLAVLDKGRKYVNLAAIILLHNKVYNFFAAIFYHRLAGNIAAGLPHPCVKKSEEIIDLGCCADCGPWIFVDGLLFDTDYRTETGDFIHIRALQRAEHIASIRRKSLYISTLPLRKDSIKCQRGFSTTAKAGYNIQGVMWESDIYIFKIMHSRTIHIDAFSSFGFVRIYYNIAIIHFVSLLIM